MDSFPGYTLPAELGLLRDQVRRFIREEIIPLEQRLDPDAGEIPEADYHRLMAKTKAAGLWCLGAPEEYGGGGVGTFRIAVLFGEMSQDRDGLDNARLRGVAPNSLPVVVGTSR